LLIQALTLKGEILERERYFNVAFNNYKEAKAVANELHQEQACQELQKAMLRAL
jgi:hypothetical protein